MKQIQTNDLDLTVEMWVQVKITLAFKLAAELQKQIDEIAEILTTDKHKKSPGNGRGVANHYRG